MSKHDPLPEVKITSTDPNSDAAFAERMRYRLTTLLADPSPLLPSYEARYNLMLEHSATLTPQQAYAMSMLLGADSSRFYPDMPNTAELRFPEVNAWQDTAQCGWYYFAGHCTAKDGKTYGVLCMLFGNTLLPPPIAAKFGLNNVQNQIIDLQLAVTVQGGGFYQVDPIVTAGTTGRVKTSKALHLEADSCSVTSVQEGKLYPIRVRAKGVDLSGDKPTEIEIDFTFTSGTGYMPQGLDGAMPLVAGMGTRYYSIPGLVMDAAASKFSLSGQPVELESGTFWMDHQWGLGLTPGGAPRFPVMQAVQNLKASSPVGWDFFALNLDNGGGLTLNSIHDPNSLKWVNQPGRGPAPSPMTVPVSGKYMDSSGTTFTVSGTLVIKDWARTESSPNPAIYHNVETWVPHGGTFTLLEGVVPERYRSFTLQHLSESAQALWYSQGARYVEAAVNLIGAGGEIVGKGYQEAVGYVDTILNMASLAGLPTTPEVIALLKKPAVTPELFWKSLAFYLGNSAEFNALIAAGSFPATPRTASDTPPPAPASNPQAPADITTTLGGAMPGFYGKGFI